MTRPVGATTTRTGDPARLTTVPLMLAAACLLLSGPAIPAAAQGVRGWAGTTVQAVDLRPVVTSGPGCPAEGPCFIREDDRTAVVGTQDVSLTAWGVGVEGLSATVFLRGRTDFGGEAVWPRSDDHFDALLGYVQMVRPGWSARLGRQEIRSGLGFSSFDGASASVRISDVTVSGYGGRSLARGLRDPARDALRGIEDFLPDQSIYLWGGSAGARTSLASATVRYQREILSDRSGLASERASFDGSVALPRIRLTGGLDWDFGREHAGKGHLTASAPLADGRWMVSATARRYVPYFSLSTIWGFFEPVAYHEVLGRVGWSPSADFGLWSSGGWRSYGETSTVTVLAPLRDTGWRGELGAIWSWSDSWRAEAGYELEWGPGGFLSSGDASVRWTLRPGLGVSVQGMTLQQIEQFRLGDGRAYGAGVSADAELTDRINFVGGASVLRHTTEGEAQESPWNQSRAWTSLRVRLGSDPGLANRGERFRR